MLLNTFIDMFILSHFAAIRINKGMCHFDVASIPFHCHFGALMFPGQGTLES